MISKLKGQQSGFTLVELMIVVAIIGLLASVAIPNFKQYQAKTKTSEAKLQLAAIYSAETAFAGDYDTYATCLGSAGYNPAGEVANRYFATGFGAENATANAIAVANGGGCAAGSFQYPGGKRIASILAAAAWVAAANCGAAAAVVNTSAASASVANEGDVFIACAIGPVDAKNVLATNASAWVIDQNKFLKKIRDGY